MKIGHVYRLMLRKFPFGVKQAVYVGLAPSRFLKFVWGDKQFLMNGGKYRDVMDDFINTFTKNNCQLCNGKIDQTDYLPYCCEKCKQTDGAISVAECNE